MKYWIDIWQLESGTVWLVVKEGYQGRGGWNDGRMLDQAGVVAITKYEDTAQLIADALAHWMQVDRAT